MTSQVSQTVISLCTLKHKDVWKLTNSLLPKYTNVDEFRVYVPNEEVDQFREITSSEFIILPQESLDTGFKSELIQAVESADNISRFGWYLQQFYKIEALRRSSSDVTIIWDADCVPVKPIEFIDNDLNLLYMYANENHKDYFQMISRLLSLPIKQEQSFVIPGFPMKKLWIEEFINFLESRHKGKTWYQAIISNTNFNLLSGFSETETLGTWVANQYPKNWKSFVGNWERFGQSKYGLARNFTPNSVSKLGDMENLSIISFENWDIKSNKNSFSKLFGSISKCKQLIIKTLIK